MAKSKPTTKTVDKIICPNCKRLHGLFWRCTGHKPNQRTLVYRCDKMTAKRGAEVLINGEMYRELRIVTKTIPAPGDIIPADNLPEENSKKYRAVLLSEQMVRWKPPEVKL